MRTTPPITTYSWHYMLEKLLVPAAFFLSPILIFNVPLYGAMMFLLLTLHLWNWDRNFREKSYIPKSVRRIFG